MVKNCQALWKRRVFWEPFPVPVQPAAPSPCAPKLSPGGFWEAAAKAGLASWLWPLEGSGVQTRVRAGSHLRLHLAGPCSRSVLTAHPCWALPRLSPGAPPPLRVSWPPARHLRSFIHRAAPAAFLKLYSGHLPQPFLQKMQQLP